MEWARKVRRASIYFEQISDELIQGFTGRLIVNWIKSDVEHAAIDGLFIVLSDRNESLLIYDQSMMTMEGNEVVPDRIASSRYRRVSVARLLKYTNCFTVALES